MVPPVLWICLNSEASCFDIAWPCFVYCFSTNLQKTRRWKKNQTNQKNFLGLQKITLFLSASARYLQCILVVIQTIDPDVIVQSRAGDRSENRQFEPFGGCLADRLAHQAVSPQSLRQDVTCLWVHLHVAGGGEVFLPDYNHVLWKTHAVIHSFTQLDVWWVAETCCRCFYHVSLYSSLLRGRQRLYLTQTNVFGYCCTSTYNNTDNSGLFRNTIILSVFFWRGGGYTFQLMKEHRLNLLPCLRLFCWFMRLNDG